MIFCFEAAEYNGTAAHAPRNKALEDMKDIPGHWNRTSNLSLKVRR
jgi:hypothetical protein